MNKYEVIETIGEGAYGIVLKCRNKETGEFVAVKRFKESEEDEMVKKTTLREVKILRLLKDEPYVVHLIEAFRRKGKLYLVFEYVGCNLLEWLETKPQGLEIEDVRRMVFTLLLALHSCHSKGVIHRDIKPENLLVVPNDRTLRLCDFGFARTYAPGNKELTDYVATRWYRSPELLLGTSDYGLPSDVWAVGCIMAELMDGNALFPGETELDQIFLIQNLLGNYTADQKATFRANKRFTGRQLTDIARPETTIDRKFGNRGNKRATHLLHSLLVVDPVMRLTVEEALLHPFFEGLHATLCPGLVIGGPSSSTVPTSTTAAPTSGSHIGAAAGSAAVTSNQAPAPPPGFVRPTSGVGAAGAHGVVPLPPSVGAPNSSRGAALLLGGAGDGNSSGLSATAMVPPPPPHPSQSPAFGDALGSGEAPPPRAWSSTSNAVGASGSFGPQVLSGGGSNTTPSGAGSSHFTLPARLGSGHRRAHASGVPASSAAAGAVGVVPGVAPVLAYGRSGGGVPDAYGGTGGDDGALGGAAQAYAYAVGMGGASNNGGHAAPHAALPPHRTHSTERRSVAGSVASGGGHGAGASVGAAASAVHSGQQHHHQHQFVVYGGSGFGAGAYPTGTSSSHYIHGAGASYHHGQGSVVSGVYGGGATVAGGNGGGGGGERGALPRLPPQYGGVGTVNSTVGHVPMGAAMGGVMPTGAPMQVQMNVNLSIGGVPAGRFAMNSGTFSSSPYTGAGTAYGTGGNGGGLGSGGTTGNGGSHARGRDQDAFPSKPQSRGGSRSYHH